MKVLVVTQYFWPENFRINDLCIELKKRGHEITVLTGIPNYPEGTIDQNYLKKPNEFQNYSGVQIIRVPLIPRGKKKLTLILNYLSFMFTCSTIGVAKVWKYEYDLVFICQLSPATVAIPGLIISRVKRVPSVMWILDLWPDSLHAIGLINNIRILNILQSVMNFVYRKCDVLLVQSRSFKNKIDEQIKCKSKVKYIPTWAEDNFSTENRIINNEKGNADFCVLFAGNIGKAQDVYCIINAAKELKEYPGIKFKIIGDGREAEGVRKAIEQLGLGKKVEMMGRYPLEDMPALFNLADAMLVTLQAKEIFSMTIPGKLQSYLASGKPIIGAINGEARKVIEESNSGFCVPAEDYVALADRILQMSMLSKEELDELGANGRRFYEEEFSREKILDKFESSLLGVLP